MTTYAAVSAIVCAPFIGSFLGCVADRLPQHRPVITGRSSCDSCGAWLTPGDLIPLVSWLRRSGKCGHCRRSISAYYPLVELAALAAAASAVAFSGGTILWAGLFLASGLLTLAAMDARHMVLADSIMVILIMAGLLVAVRLSRLPLGDHLIGAISGYAVLSLIASLYRWVRSRDGLGDGDPKLLAVGGAWLGWQGLPSVILWSVLLALPVVLAIGLGGRRVAGDVKLPFGTFLCAGIWLTWILGPLSFGPLQ